MSSVDRVLRLAHVQRSQSQCYRLPQLVCYGGERALGFMRTSPLPRSYYSAAVDTGDERLASRRRCRSSRWLPHGARGAHRATIKPVYGPMCSLCSATRVGWLAGAPPWWARRGRRRRAWSWSGRWCAFRNNSSWRRPACRGRERRSCRADGSAWELLGVRPLRLGENRNNKTLRKRLAHRPKHVNTPPMPEPVEN